MNSIGGRSARWTNHLVVSIDRTPVDREQFNFDSPLLGSLIGETILTPSSLNPAELSKKYLSQATPTNSGPMAYTEEPLEIDSTTDTTTQYSELSTVESCLDISQTGPRFGHVTPENTVSFGCSIDMSEAHLDTYVLRQTHSSMAEILSRPKERLPPSPIAPRKSYKRSARSRCDAAGPTLLLSEKRRLHNLEKNKVAAARCRAKRTVQTDLLREASQSSAALNTRLRQEVMDRLDEVQQLQKEVLCHVVTGVCKAPNEMRAILSPLARQREPSEGLCDDDVLMGLRLEIEQTLQMEREYSEP